MPRNLAEDPDAQGKQLERGTDPYRLGAAIEALAELDKLDLDCPEAFKCGINRSAIEGVVEALLGEIERIKLATGPG